MDPLYYDRTDSIDLNDEALAPAEIAEGAPLVRNPKIRSQRERDGLDRDNAEAKLSWPRVSVVVPARNEALNIPIVFATIPTNVYEIIVVDGNSTDGTAEVALSTRPDVRVVNQPGDGKGDALAAGFAACRGDIVVMMDADGSMDGAEIPRFVAALVGGADFAKGSRYMQDSHSGSTDITRIRSFGNLGLRSAVNILFGSRYTDLCYGYAAFWRWTLPLLDLQCDGFEVETLMNIRAQTTGMKIAEVASMEAERIHGVSNLNAVRDGLRILRVIIQERVSPRRAAPGAIEAGERASQSLLTEII
jgi:glycosyltransferase involved in cell wall biosynthesis